MLKIYQSKLQVKSSKERQKRFEQILTRIAKGERKPWEQLALALNKTTTKAGNKKNKLQNCWDMTQYKFNQLSCKSRTSTSLTSCWLNPKTNTLQPGIWKLQKWAIFGELFPFPGCSRLPHIPRAALNFVFTEVFKIYLILFVQQLLFPLSCLLVSNINEMFNPLSFPCFRLKQCLFCLWSV